MSFLENLRRKGRSRPAVRSTRRRPLMEELESRVVMSSNVFSGSTGDDVILLRRDPNNAAALEVKITQGTKTTTDVSLTPVAGDTITLKGLGGNDIYTIENTFFNVPVTVSGGVNNDTVNVSPTARNLDNIDGQVSVKGGGGGTDTLTIYDQNDPIRDTYTETSSSVSRTRSQPISYSGIGAVNVYSGTGRVTHQVDSTAAGVATTIVGNTNEDDFVINRSGMNFGSIAGNLTLNAGGGLNSLAIYDQNNPTSSAYTVTGTTVARSGSATLTYSSMVSVVIDGSLVSGVGGTYDIVSTSANTPVSINAGTGNHTFIVSPTGRNLDAVAGNLFLSYVSGKGINTLVVNDQNNPNPDTFTVTSSSVSRTHSARIQFVGTTTVNAGSGNNTVSVVSTPTSGKLTFDGGGGTDFLVPPNSVNTFDITGLNAGSLGLLNFSSVESLYGSAMADTFSFEDAGALSGTIYAEGNTDTLDFSKKTTPVTLDLTNHKLTVSVSASGPTYTVNVFDIENANGGSANDILIGSSLANDLEGNGGNDIIVGNAGNDNLNGGGGLDVVIGGLGSDILEGRGDSDLLIGGTTSYDANTAALQAILNEWTSGKGYATRVSNLKAGVGLSGGNLLKSTGAGRTVFDDGSADTLTGGQEHDWFFTATGDVITDLNDPNPETTN